MATEEVVYLLELLGIEHGVDVKKLIETGNYISSELTRENLSRVKITDFEQIDHLRNEIFA